MQSQCRKLVTKRMALLRERLSGCLWQLWPRDRKSMRRTTDVVEIRKEQAVKD